MEEGTNHIQDTVSASHWPPEVVNQVVLQLEARVSAGNRQSRLCQALEEAAQHAIALWNRPADVAENMTCEKWLCVADVVMDELRIAEWPRTSWPAQLQLLGILANASCEDPAFFRVAGADLAVALTPEQSSQDVKAVVQDLITILNYIAVLCSLRTGLVKTVEELHLQVHQVCAEAGVDKGPQKSWSRTGGTRTPPPRTSESNLGINAASVLKDLLCRLTEEAFDAPLPEAVMGAQLHGMPLPSADVIQRAVANTEAVFPAAVRLKDTVVQLSSLLHDSH